MHFNLLFNLCGIYYIYFTATIENIMFDVTYRSKESTLKSKYGSGPSLNVSLMYFLTVLSSVRTKL